MSEAVAVLDDIMKKVYEFPGESREEIEQLLLLEDNARIERLFSFADKVRRKFMGDGVLLRGIVEFSNRCSNTCFYCGLNERNSGIERYVMSIDAILGAVGVLSSVKIKTVVLQSGEDECLDPLWLARLIGEIKKNHGLAVTLSVGEKSRDEYKLWREAGADRYLLKIETTDPQVYSAAHDGRRLAARLKCLDDLIDLGYQTGSGMLIGLRGQTVGSIARDILYLKEKEFDMIGIGPFVPHSGTVFANDPAGDVRLTLKALAITRLVTKNAHIPATAAMGSIGGHDYRVDGLKAGANVLMPNFTPMKYRKLYEIYPGRICINEAHGACVSCMGAKAASAGRFIDYSAGHSLKKHRALNPGGENE